jgi:hypothetical protein
MPNIPGTAGLGLSSNSNPGGSLQLSGSLFSGASQAVSDLFQGQEDQAKAQAADAQATQAQDTAQADVLKSTGDTLEGNAYGQAATLSELNATYATASTNIQAAQTQRQTFGVIGSQRADVAGAGLAESGSALDLLRSSASQGALAKSLVESQGQITVAGYQQQAESYTAMQQAAGIASQEDILASQGEQAVATSDLSTASAYNTAASGSDVAAGIAGLGAVASIFGV